MQKEIEIKIKIESEDDIINKLKGLGFSFVKEYQQTTYQFFAPDWKESGVFPRIRKEGDDIVLTVKVRPKEKSEYFERTEYSMKISSVEEGADVLIALGYKERREFTKKRQEWKGESVKVCLDELYFGKFLELEGEKEGIEEMIKGLGFENKERITKAYLALEDEYKKLNHGMR